MLGLSPPHALQGKLIKATLRDVGVLLRPRLLDLPRRVYHLKVYELKVYEPKVYEPEGIRTKVYELKIQFYSNLSFVALLRTQSASDPRVLFLY